MGSKTPRVSVILPTYNQAEYLPHALDSIFNQTYSDFELIVVNDGSTDETPAILEEYHRRYDFRLIHQENQKLPQTLNNGFQLAQGEYLTWTSSDNIMLPNMLEILVAALDANPAVGMVYADWEVIDGTGNLVGTVNTLDFDPHILMRVNFINACFLYRHECQETVGLYNPEYIHAEDWEYWYRISRFYNMMRVPQVLYQYRIHGRSLTETEVLTQVNGDSIGYQKLENDFRSNLWSWYYSKLKWKLLRLKLKRPPLSTVRASG